MIALADAMYSVNRALLVALARRLAIGQARSAGRPPTDGGCWPSWTPTYPEAVHEVLTYPYIQAWATHCLDPAGNRR